MKSTNGATRRRIGMLIPSSNTVVESVASAILAEVPGVSAHMSRLPVLEISLANNSQLQFRSEPMLGAADLLADARVQVMGWNGTSASWLGFEHDRHLCEMMTERYGIPTTTAVLAVNELLQELAVRRIALVTPYIDSVQADIVSHYRNAGYDCAAERHIGEHVNDAFAEIDDNEIVRMIREVATHRPSAIVVMCTNMRAAHLIDALEREIDIPIIDSLAAFVWKSLRLIGIETAQIAGWGRIFQCVGAAPSCARR